MKLIFTGGGTGGHVYPAVAIAEEMRAKRPDTKLLFIGRSGGDENRAVETADIPLTTLNVRGISRNLSPKNLGSIILALRAEISARKVIKDFAPDAVIGTGGYVSWPVLHAAHALGIPTAIHESNAYPGLVTRILSKHCDLTLLGNRVTAGYLKNARRLSVVGNPLRRGFKATSKQTARSRLGIYGGRRLLVSFGGSIGATKVNDSCISLMKSFSAKRKDIIHIHATGKRYFDEYARQSESLPDNCKLVPYIDDMPTVLSAADAVICRCGAMTLAEIAATGTPAILIPSPNVTDDHQYKNGKSVAESGGALLIEEEDLTEERLAECVKRIVDSAAKNRKMSKCIASLARTNAAEGCVFEIMGIIGGVN